MLKKSHHSKKRSAILETLRSTKVHPTAEWVYNQLKPKYTDLSLGTVYRNIKKFCENGDVISVGVINGQEHFDGNVYPHTHFVCEHCGVILDVEETFLSDLEKENLSSNYGFVINTEEVVFKGLCKNCLI